MSRAGLRARPKPRTLPRDEAARLGHSIAHEQERRLLGQRCDGEFLLDPEDRKNEPQEMPDTREVRADVSDYIERFYSPRRRHSPLGQVSPDQFSKRPGLP